MNADYVSITQERYEELLDAETRMDVLTERLINDKYLKTEDACGLSGPHRR